MSVASLLGRLLNLRAGEGRRLSVLYAMSLVALTGASWADAIVLGAFLELVGVRYLPWVFIASAACSVGALLVYGAFADRMSNTRLLIAILAVSGVGGLLGLAAIIGGLVAPAYVLLYLVLNVPLMDVYNVHWATYVNGFYDIRTAKRIVPVLGTAARLAGIIAGLSMPLMNRLLSPAGIIGLWLGSMAIMATVAAVMPRLVRDRGPRRADWRSDGQTGATPAVVPTARARRVSDRRGGASSSDVAQRAAELPASPAARAREGPAGRVGGGSRGRVQRFARLYGTNLREGYQQVARSPFLRWMALSTLSMTVVGVLLWFAASVVFEERLKTTVAIANFLGVLTGVGNAVALPIQLLVVSRVITRFGLGNASLVYPLTTATAAGGLVAAPGLGTAAFAYVDSTVLRTAFRSPVENLLNNAVPLRVRARTRAFVAGMVVPIGTILAAVLLLLPMTDTSWFLPATILVSVLPFVVTALLVRRHYGAALVDLLEDEDYSSLALRAPSLHEPSAPAAVDQATLTRLAEKLRDSQRPERAVFLAQLITAVGGEAAVSIVGAAARSASDGRLRASLVDVLVAADARRGGARELYAGLLGDHDGRVRLAAIAGLEQISGPRDRRYLETATRLLADPEIEVRLRVLPALLAAGEAAPRAAATGELRTLLQAAHPHTRARALSVVGQAGATPFLPEVARALADRADEVRLAAALAAELLVQDALARADREAVLASAPPLLDDSIERVRVAAVTVLGQLGQDGGPEGAAPREALFAAFADPSPDVREQAVEALAHAGRPAIPQLRARLDAADPRQRTMAAVVLARIQPRKFAALVRGSALDDNLLNIYRNLACEHALSGCPGPAADVLRRALRERNAALLDEIGYLLSTIHDPEAIGIVMHALRSPQADVRANATEALESLTAPRTATLISPLLQPDRPAEQVLGLATQTWNISIPIPAAAIQRLLSDPRDAWHRTLAAAVVRDLHAAAGPTSRETVAGLLRLVQADPDPAVRAEAGPPLAHPLGSWMTAVPEDGHEKPLPLSLVQRLIVLKDVSFFGGMPIAQLKVLASVCEQEAFPKGARIFSQGDAGGSLYLVVSGSVGIEQEKRKGSVARLATLGAPSYFGETGFFANDRHTASATAITDTLALRLRREPVIALARHDPELSLELINVLSGRLRDATNRMAELSRTHSREVHKIYDELA